MKKWLWLFSLSCCLILSQPLVGETSGVKHEIRGVWLTNIDSDVLFDQAKTSNAIATLAQLNFNTIYPTVWNGGYTLYPSPVAQQVTGELVTPLEDIQAQDLLQDIIDHSHKRGMAVIPWFEFGFMAPAESTLAQNHPQWLTQRLNGETIWMEGKVHPRVWLNPLNPEVQQLITDLATEIVGNYPVDGIQFDDHFGYPADFGYDPLTVSLYQADHQGNSPPVDSQDPEWVQWRADQITKYMQKLFTAIKAANPQAIVSVSPNPQQFSLQQYLLDWHRWERLGLIEELVVQIYRQDLAAFQSELAQPELQQARSHIPVAIGVLSGLKGRPVGWDTIATQVEEVRQQEFGGVSFFFYESLWNLAQEDPQVRLQSFRSLFPQLLTRPRVS